MTQWIGLFLDLVLIGVVGTGVVQAVRLIRQLQDLRASRAEMERFVHEFNSAVTRAEAGIKGLRSVARESGDDLEKLIEKASLVRDELSFIIDSAEGVSERLARKTSTVMNTERAPDKPPETAGVSELRPKKQAQPKVNVDMPAATKAEKELLQALKKML